MTGLVGVWWQALALTLAVAPVWLTQLGARLPESTTSNILLTGLVASRFGLWLFDLSVSQMLQEWIPAADIGELHDDYDNLCIAGTSEGVVCCCSTAGSLRQRSKYDMLLLCRTGEWRSKQPSEPLSKSVVCCWPCILETTTVCSTHVQLCCCGCPCGCCL